MNPPSAWRRWLSIRFLRCTLFAVLADLRDEGITILLVDQMAGLALSVADRGYVLQSGTVVHEGPAATMQNDPEIEKAYLGTVE